eukprot:1389334-Ditylum_brightwellii.AAC.1
MKGTEGNQVFRDIASNCHGNKLIYPVLPSLLTSTDNTVLFVHKSKKNKERKDGRTYIAPVNHNKKLRICLKHHLKKRQQGMRARLTTSINGAGQVSAIYVAIRGLAQREILIREDDEDSKAGIVVKEIPGLCLS